MTYELLFALFLALSPYLHPASDQADDPIYELTAQEAIQQARTTCRTLLQHKEIILFNVPLGQFIDEMIGSVPPEQIAGIFAEDFQPKLNKLGLDYNEAIQFYLSICHSTPSEKYTPDMLRIDTSLALLNSTRDKILAYLSQIPLGTRPGSDDSPYHTVFRLQNGEVVFDSAEASNSPWIPLDQIPLQLQQALVAVEDKQFYKHRGIDISSLIRAASKSMDGNYQGGSTITQQLVKNLYYFNKDDDKSLKNPRLRRKLGELITARELELAWGKNAVLEAYLNIVNFGRGARGAGAAAEYLFGKPLSELDLSQIATLAAMPKRPGAFVHRKYFEKLKERQHYVLKQMLQEGYIKEDQIAPNLLNHFPFLDREASSRVVSPLNHYIRAAKKEAFYQQNRKDHAIDGTLALHPGFQELAKTALLKGLLDYERKFKGRSRSDKVPIVQGAVVIMDNHSGDVLALQGGTPYVHRKGAIVQNEFDRATRGYRQPGSTIKPISYLMALESGLSPNKQIPNYELELPLLSEHGQPWRVRNYDGGESGSRSMRYGLEYSKNLMTAWLLEMAPYYQYDYIDPYSTHNPSRALDAVRRLSVQFGIYCSETEEQQGQCPKPMSAPKRHYPFILGAQETSLLRMVTAYARIANGGKIIHPQFIKRFRLAPKGSSDNAYNLENPLNESSRLYSISVDPRSLFQLKSMLVGVTKRGTAARLAKYGDRVAGKTGTTDDYRDAWFIGFTQSITIGVWVGYVDRSSLGSKASGSRVALPIFDAILGPILKGTPQQPYLADFPPYDQHDSLLSDPPEGLVALATNPKTGCIQERSGGKQFLEYFKEEHSNYQDNDDCEWNNDDYWYTSKYTNFREAPYNIYSVAPSERTEPIQSDRYARDNDGHFGSSSWIMSE